MHYNMFCHILLSTLLLSSMRIGDGKIMLTKTNHVSINGKITDRLADHVIRRASDIKRDIDKPTYLYINSPGGSVIAGNRIVRHVLHHNYTCIADRAMSMAFVIFQACEKRVVMHGSMLMQHQQSLGVDGNLENINSYLRMVNVIDQELTKMQAKRLHMSPVDFKDKTSSDWWLYGEEIINAHAADEVDDHIECDPELYTVSHERTESERFLFFEEERNITYNGCPLVYH